MMALSACVPAERDVEEVVDFDTETTMGAIQARGAMTIAVPDDLPPFSSLNEAGQPEGFIVELAEEVASALRVDVEYVTASAEEGLELTAEGEVDLAFPIAGVTEGLARRNNLSAPYWVAHTRLLVPSASDVDGIEDLAGETVCHYDEEHTTLDLEALETGISTIDVKEPDDCVAELRDGRALVAVAPDIYLMDVATELGDYEIRGDELSTAGYGAAMPGEASDLSVFVNRVFGDTKSEGRWLEHYEEWLAPVASIEEPNAPDLTIEEVATLWPLDLEQP